jgi:3-hydroxyisobutyrate dehydrogenase-like beta-hydroxyacid dehydrogenase
MNQASKKTETEKIGIIGPGRVGGWIAGKYLEKGYAVYVYDKNRSAIDRVCDKGAIACRSPKEVAERADIILETTSNDISAREVWLGSQGILAGSTPGKTGIACSTLSVAFVDELGAKCDEAQLAFFDIPLAFSAKGPELLCGLLCGGTEEGLRGVRPALQVFAHDITYFGSRGHGMRCKLIYNYMQAVHLAAFGQAMKIARDQHMDIQAVGATLAKRIGGRLTEGAWASYQSDDEGGNLSVEQITKDLTYAKELATNVDAGLLDAVLAAYKRAVAKDLSQKAWTVIIKLD